MSVYKLDKYTRIEYLSKSGWTRWDMYGLNEFVGDTDMGECV